MSMDEDLVAVVAADLEEVVVAALEVGDTVVDLAAETVVSEEVVLAEEVIDSVAEDLEVGDMAAVALVAVIAASGAVANKATASAASAAAIWVAAIPIQAIALLPRIQVLRVAQQAAPTTILTPTTEAVPLTPLANEVPLKAGMAVLRQVVPAIPPSQQQMARPTLLIDKVVSPADRWAAL
jgi:hypothetical protein